MPAKEWHDKDKSGKWLIEHHGDVILSLDASALLVERGIRQWASAVNNSE
jgi:hypothetical protein